MEATLARDAEAAVKALSDHLALTADIILETFASRPAGPGG
jgi:DNA-binding GntR family transcriptional regulator